MSENQGEDASINLTVDADEALTVFEQLSQAARDTDEQIQQLKQHLTQQVATTFGAQGLRPQTYEQATGFLSRMDPAEVAQAAPDIAQTKTALAARSTDIQAQAMAYAGTTPGLASQPPADVLAQFQDAMAAREQQQQAQRERQAQQQAAGAVPPARYGYDQSTLAVPSHASSTSAPIPSAPTIQATGTTPMTTVAPLATAGDERLAHALSAQTPTGTSAAVRATGARANDENAPIGDVLPAESGRSSPTPVGVQPVASLATTGDERLAHALSAQVPTATPPTGRATTDTPPLASTGELPNDLQRLAVAAIAADEGIRRLQQHLVEQVNTDMGAAGIRPKTFEQAQDLLARMPSADLAAAAPDVVTTQQRIAARSGELTGQVAAFGAQAGQVTTGQPTSQLLDELKTFVQQQQQAAAGGASTAPNGGAGSGAATSAVARYGLPTTPPALTPGNDTTQTDRLATTMGERLASSMARAGVGMVAGGIQGAANAAGMGATGDVIAGLARPLLAMVSAPLAIGAAVVGGVAGIGLGVNALQSKYAGEQQTLAGSVGTTTGATPSSELTTAQNVGWSMMFHESQSVAAAQQLGDAGVQSGQLGGALTASMALARVGGIGLDQTTALTGQMMQGGMSANQVGATYAQMDQAARETGISLGRFAEAMKAVNQAAGVGQISMNGLASAQALSDQTGTKIDIGQAMAGTIGSTGTNALVQGALLGLNPAQFEQAQLNPAKLMDSYAALARRYDVGTGGVQVAQQALSAAGFDFSGMKGPQADEYTRRLATQGPGAAQAYEDSLTKKEKAPGAPGPHTFDDMTKAAVHISYDITNAGDQLKIKGQQAGAELVRGGAMAANELATALSKQPLTQLSRTHQATQDTQNRTQVNGPFPTHGPSGIGSDGGINLGAIGYDASGDKAFGAVSERTLLQGRDTGLWVGGGPGKGAMVEPQTFVALEQAATKTGVPLSILLAQSKQEATNSRTGMIDPKLVSSDGGYGLGQFTDPGAAVKYLNQASGQLGDGPVTASNWHAAALNPRIAAQAMADYDQANIQGKAAGGRWDRALAEYNGGPHPNAQAQHYGASVYGAAQQLQGQIGVTVTVKNESGHHIARTQTTHNVTAHPVHSIDPTRRHVAAQSYGPQDRTPPAPGIPTLPGHIK